MLKTAHRRCAYLCTISWRRRTELAGMPCFSANQRRFWPEELLAGESLRTARMRVFWVCGLCASLGLCATPYGMGGRI